ncbi:MAG TPA: ThuA domain-containing protein, partial [Chitinophagaceae bacterium]|nr:ThuA domain-containing protein [Chitinophagaceae bacterium]
MLANILFKKIFLLLALAAGITLQSNNGPAATAKENKVLVFAKTNGYHHESIAAGLVAIQKLGQENKFAVDTTTDSLQISDANLKQYKVIVFLSTTGKVLGT